MASLARLAAAAALLLSALGVGFLLVQNRPAQAYEGIPRAYQEYWTWVSELNTSASGVEDGLRLLARYPHLKPLYVRLGHLCARQQQQACAQSLRAVRPPDALTARYRQAALALLDADGRAPQQWAALAAAADLDPALVRLVVEHGAGQLGLEKAAALWQRQLGEDSTRIAPAFGLALTALAANDWRAAQTLLLRLETLAPDEPDVYRELGRVYYQAGQNSRLRETLLQGIAVAEGRYEFENTLVLRGNLALALLQRGTDLDLAERMLDEAIAQGRLLADGERLALNRYRMAALRAQQMRYRDALALLDSAQGQAAPRLATQIQALRGTVEWSLFRFSDARATLVAAQAAARAQGLVLEQIQAGVSLTQLYGRLGRHADARAVGLEALELAHRYGFTDAAIAARIALGDTEAAAGNFDQSVAQYQSALEQARRTGIAARVAEASTRLAQALLELKDASGAADYLDRALAGTAAEAQVYEGLGRIYYAHGNYERALDYFTMGVAAARRDPARRVSLRVNEAWTHLALGSLDAARQALDAAHAVRGAADEAQARFLIRAAEATYLYEKEDLEGARAAFADALAQATALDLPSHQWYLLHGEALCAWRLGDAADAERAFRSAIAVVEALRDNLRGSTQRATFIQDKVLLYKNFAAFLTLQGRTDEAFHFTERARSRSLADLFTTTLSDARDDGSPEMRLAEARRRQQALSQGIDEVYRGVAGQPDRVRAAQLRSEFGRADSLYRASLAGLDADGVYTALSHPVQAAAVQAVLRPDEALVMYSVGSADGRGMGGAEAFVVTARQVRVVALPTSARAIRQGVTVFREQISPLNQRPGQGWEPTSQKLYADLVAPVVAALPPGITHLSIVPEAELHYLPFAALRDTTGQFLVQRFALSTVPSASLFCLTRARGDETRGRWRRVVALADPTGRLPGARREVEALGRIKAIRVDALFGAQATRENLRLLVPEADILHIATHGLFDPRRPWASGLELSGGALTVSEVGQIGLDRPYLVVLSACETALGSGTQSDVPPGDEWVGLNQAFLAAGAPSVVASLWPISDRASSRLVEHFYNALLDEEDKAEALAQMQRYALSTPSLRHPYYWAAFTLSGDAR